MNDANTAKVLDAISAIGSKIDGLDKKIEGLDKRLSSLEIQVSKIEGQNSIIVSWMTSMDQRYSAIMAPYQPPKAGAAE
jgi:hypothetical protein